MKHDEKRYDAYAAKLKNIGGVSRGLGRMIDKGAFLHPRWAQKKLLDNLITRDVKPGERVCEYGCYIGGPSVVVAGLRTDVEVVGFDISTLSAQKAQELADALGLSNATYSGADALKTGYPDSFIDHAFGFGILHHIHQREAFVELARILKPGGRATFVEPTALNLFVRLFRKIRIKPYSPNEHPYTFAMLHELQEWAPGLKVRWRFEHLFSMLWLAFFLAAGPLKKSAPFLSFYYALQKPLGRLDDLILGFFPFLYPFSQLVSITFEKQAGEEGA